MLKYSVLSNFNKLIFIFIFNGGRKHNTSTKSRQCMFWPLKKQKIKKATSVEDVNWTGVVHHNS